MRSKATERTTVMAHWRVLVFVGLSLSIGWGIRGNFGHEWGAALPGALAAMAVVLLSEREDWLRRIAYFAMFGAVGWSFGGSMAYMVLIAYTHSGDSPSVLYGFCCLFIVGFLWGAVGGAATALPAYLTRERLAQFCVPMTLIFLAWWADEFLQEHFIDSNVVYSRHNPLYWNDSNWISALLVIAVVLVRAAFRRRFDWAERLILAMAAGWWVGFLLLAIGLRLHMIPSRSDNWAGVIGMTAAMWLYLWRHDLRGVVLASITTGFIGGLGFASATVFKLIELKSGVATNWHSVLEQSYGLINGLGVAVAMNQLRTRAPRVSDDPPSHRWTEVLAVFFVLVVLTFFNLRKEVNDWIGAKAILPVMYGLSTHVWFDLLYALAAIVVLLLLREQLRRPLPIVPATWLGKGQMLYLALLWWMVTGNFMKAVVAFTPQRLVTEGVITVNALFCTLMALLWAREARQPHIAADAGYGLSIKRTLAMGGIIFVVSSLTYWGAVRAIYGNTFAGYAGHHIRFGPRQTSNRE
jgi:hypothetical protein